MLWSNQLDLGVPVVFEALRLCRFHQVKLAFHLADSITLANNTDKMAKIKSLYDSLSNAFSQYGFFYEILSIDESVVPYFDKHKL